MELTGETLFLTMFDSNLYIASANGDGDRFRLAKNDKPKGTKMDLLFFKETLKKKVH